MMIFDITNTESFEAINDKWLPEVDYFTGVSCHMKYLKALIITKL